MDIVDSVDSAGITDVVVGADQGRRESDSLEPGSRDPSRREPGSLKSGGRELAGRGPGRGREREREREPLWRDVIGEVLRGERQAQERTLQDVADAAMISMPYLSELERGRKEASSEILAAAANALGLRLSDLLDLALFRLGSYEQAALVGSPAGSASIGARSRETMCLAA